MFTNTMLAPYVMGHRLFSGAFFNTLLRNHFPDYLSRRGWTPKGRTKLDKNSLSWQVSIGFNVLVGQDQICPMISRCGMFG